MVVILHPLVTGSAEIVVNAGSSSDENVVIADFLGMTLGDVARKLERRGYRLSFVTDHYLVFERQGRPLPRSRRGPTMFRRA
ncbi:hypothetical protein [Alicyclobacillus vulcanalis]|uniref:Uncharacterized protein n=1 Tax=Alicyclobacillus vulcanalis TaxID=252246 RepID=A0A1N7M133_9BACL|nr:hypothetical protein [Alicyclobacillus vulcanalis]SIS79798.1 hypothetical protein SAMN05421799_104144 [Alicyclobacillus vulcanalis]